MAVIEATTVGARLLLRRGTSAEWAMLDSILGPGEPGYETDTGRLKIGDGVTRWSALGYFSTPTAAHTHTAAQISNASPIGRSVLTAADAAAVQAVIGAVAGTNTPTRSTIPRDLWVEREWAPGTVEADLSNVGYGTGPVIHGRRTDGTKAAPTAAPAGLIWGIGSRPYTGTKWTEHSTAAIHWVAPRAMSDADQETFMRFHATPAGKTNADRVGVLDIAAADGGGRLEADFSSATQLARTLFRTNVAGQGTSVGAVPRVDTAAAQWNAFGRADPTNSPYGALKATASAVDVIAGGTGTAPPVPLHLTIGATRAVSVGIDGVIDRLAVPKARALKSATTSVPNATYTAVPYETEVADNDGMYDPAAPTRLTARTAGTFRVTATVMFASNATGDRIVTFRVNGAVDDRFGYQSAKALTGLGTGVTATAELDLAAGDYVEVWVYQTSTAALNVDSEGVQRGRCRFSMTYASA